MFLISQARFVTMFGCFLIPITMVLNIANIVRLIIKRKYLFAFLSSAITVALLLIIVAIELYAHLVISTANAANTLTIFNSSSSSNSLQIQLIFVAVGVPLAILYTGFIFWTFRGKVKLNEMSY
jgi:cytochrome bd ubiquinol oxidase subunit II